MIIKELKNHNPHILVVGDLMIDHYLWGECNRISPEAPVQVVDIKKESSVLGGAGNVINNLVTFGAKVSVATVVGDGENTKELFTLLQSIDVDCSNIITSSQRKTSKKSRVISSNQQIIRFDKEDTSDIDKNNETKIIELITQSIDKYEIIILSDYGKGVLTNSLTQKLITLAKSKKIKVLVDPKGDDYNKYSGAFLLTPNKKEASIASKITIDTDKALIKTHQFLKQSIHLDYSIITLSEDGISIYDDKLTQIPTVAQEVYDVTGAGDTVIASIAYGLTYGFSVKSAVEFANYAAAVVVAKIGSATATLSEIEEYVSSLHKSSTQDHIVDINDIELRVKALKQRGKKIVFTNGCFDILHVGHVKYLEIAKSFGDVLILGLNSDESVRALKGESRPINTQDDRAYILSALESVDYVVPFESDTPYELIRLIKPNILVKGGDYKGKEVVGSDIADELKLVDFIDGKSTTNTIKNIQCQHF